MTAERCPLCQGTRIDPTTGGECGCAPAQAAPKPHWLEGKLEPEASRAASPQEAAALSLAISMKRIADCLDGTALGVDVSGSISSPMAWRDIISDAVRS